MLEVTEFSYLEGEFIEVSSLNHHGPKSRSWSKHLRNQLSRLSKVKFGQKANLEKALHSLSQFLNLIKLINIDYELLSWEDHFSSYRI